MGLTIIVRIDNTSQPTVGKNSSIADIFEEFSSSPNLADSGTPKASQLKGLFFNTILNLMGGPGLCGIFGFVTMVSVEVLSKAGCQCFAMPLYSDQLWQARA